MKNGSIALLLAILAAAPALAQRDDATPEEKQAVREMVESVTEVFEQIWVPRSRYTSGPHVREAFRPVVSETRRATVEVRQNRKRIALGAIVGPDGWILTKGSLIRGAVTCRLKDGREFDARVVGIDEPTDLAMLKIDAKDLPVLAIADAAPGGQQFVALRSENPPADPAVDEQADEQAKQESEGKPTPSAAGMMPGDWLATVGLARDPIAVGVLSVLPREIEKRDGFLGIRMDVNATPQPGKQPAVVVESVTPDSAASEAGLQPGDRILSVDSHPTATPQDLGAVIRGRNPGDRIELRVERDEQKLTLMAILRGWAPNAAERRAYYQNNLGGKLSQRRFGFPTALQHDTVLDPDQCGGPVVDLEGRVVGINISRAGRTETYALPVDLVRSRLFDLMSGRLAPIKVK
ncbi:Putative serine protease HtrA [Planctomycetes bacterium MalM25]|nr:Putative serine protease HtrA [Planctomycetes bacterium MalM25]